MKSKLIITSIILAFILSNCTYPKYLPKRDNIGVSEYGSYIKVKRTAGKKIRGELLVIDTTGINVLTNSHSKNKVVFIPIKEIRRFKLKYAKPSAYWWTIPVYSLASIGHGAFLIFSLPINLAVTVTTTTNSNSVYNYNDLTYKELKMFARFPQGIPQNIDISDIE
ncbi:MAG: hypothetical protein KGY70_14755 [Bacteroidales bacterium]|nr:hypothetical protein [Bacteroidales bacterium]MBS3776453.1 hypothetical protein [Bacteroidales bacterium]